MHLGSPSDPSQTSAAEAKPRYVHSILKPHSQSSRGTVRACHTPVFYPIPSVSPKHLCAIAHLGSTRAAGIS